MAVFYGISSNLDRIIEAVGGSGGTFAWNLVAWDARLASVRSGSGELLDRLEARIVAVWPSSGGPWINRFLQLEGLVLPFPLQEGGAPLEQGGSELRNACR